LDEARSHFSLDDSRKIPKIDRKGFWLIGFGLPARGSNSVLIIVACILFAFWLRDYMSLHMSPSYKATRRALAYGASTLLTAVLIWTLAVRMGLADSARWIQSPRILFLLIAVHIGASVPCIWVKQTQCYNRMWATALLPAPIVWLLLSKMTFLSEDGLGMAAPQFSFFVVVGLWVLSMLVVVFRTRRIQMSVEDLDFAVLFGSWSHWLALCTLPLLPLLT
jgi:hypothetical protein